MTSRRQHLAHVSLLSLAKSIRQEGIVLTNSQRDLLGLAMRCTEPRPWWWFR